MSLTADDVKSAWSLLCGRSLSEEEAEEQAQLLDSREEMLASLITRESIFDSDPSVVDALVTAAARGYSAPRTPRQERGDPIRQLNRTKDLSKALSALIQAERNHAKLTADFHEAMRNLVRGGRVSLSDAGYHWSFEREKNKSDVHGCN